MQELLSVICNIAGDVFVFQQDSAPTHRAHDTVELLCDETPFINRDMLPANITDLNPVDHHIFWKFCCLSVVFEAIHFFGETV